MRYFAYYILVIIAFLCIAPKIKEVLNSKRVVAEKIYCDTSAYKVGSIVVVNENGIRWAMPCDSAFLGIITVSDTSGVVVVKYLK